MEKTPVIAVCDVNTIWRHRPFSALAECAEVLAFAPGDLRTARHPAKQSEIALPVVNVTLPPGWASKTAWLGQRLLWRRMQAEAKARGQQINCVVLTSPHYLTLLKNMPKDVQTVYYASDDYRSYLGWKNMAALEADVARWVDHSIFISNGLAQRACNEYGVAIDKVSVSMNATEPRFFPSVDETPPSDPPCGPLPRPIAGVVGGINERLDFDLLLRCADRPELGSLLLVGPLPEARPGSLQRLLQHPKCRSVGGQPHDTLHHWYKCLDVGLIPYAESSLNRYCSPMRLFDHLASGQPIIATNACEQVNEFKDVVSVCNDRDMFLISLRKILRSPASFRHDDIEGIRWSDRVHQLMQVCEAG